jgi:hypothetical protein
VGSKGSALGAASQRLVANLTTQNHLALPSRSVSGMVEKVSGTEHLQIHALSWLDH